MTPLERLSRITTSLGRASELTLQRIETELGLTPRPESPDAGAPYGAMVCPEYGMGGPCMWSECHHPVLTRNGKYMGQENDNPNAGMTPVSERETHE